jgi:phage terminase large subunit
MAKEINLSSLWNPAFNTVWNAISSFVVGKEGRGDRPPCKYDELFLQGGRASGKSYFASVIVWLALENDPKKNAVIFRKVGSSLRKSCWKQMTKVWKRLQLDHWRPNKTDMTFTNKLTGQQIYFLGLDDEEKARSITVDNGYLSIAWFEEAKQFKDMEEIDQAVSSILRGGDEDDDDAVKGDDIDDDGELNLGDMEYMTILTYNPPKSHFDWINKEAKTGISKKSRLTHKSTYLTMPPRWLGRKVLSEINSMKERKPAQYEHMYLGKITGTGGEYFKNITIRKITDEEIANFDYFNMGIDWGYHDPNVWLKTYIRDGRMYIFDEIYQNEIPPDGKKYVEFAKKVKKKTRNCPDDTIYCDAQDKGGMAVFKLDEFDIPIVEAPKQGANGRLAGYSYFQGLDEIIIDPDRCPHSAVEFPMFEAKLAPGGKGWLDEPGTKGDHCPDAARYSEWENIRNNSRNEDYEPIGDMDDDDDGDEEFEIADIDDYFDDVDDE